jgi:hypothetical protein
MYDNSGPRNDDQRTISEIRYKHVTMEHGHFPIFQTHVTTTRGKPKMTT